MALIEIDWGAGYVRHFASKIERLGAAYRVSVSVPARFSRDTDFSFTRVRFRDAESIGSRVERVESQSDGSCKLTLLVVPRAGSQPALDLLQEAETSVTAAPTRELLQKRR